MSQCQRPFDPATSAELDELDDCREAVRAALRACQRQARRSPTVGPWYTAGHALLAQIEGALRSVQLEVGL